MAATNPYGEGYEAANEGRDEEENPYPINSDNWNEWRNGWYSRKHEGQQN